MTTICKIWFHIMNLYVISLKSVYGTSKMDLKWKRYNPLKFPSKTCFVAKRSWKEEGWRQPAHHVSFICQKG